MPRIHKFLTLLVVGFPLDILPAQASAQVAQNTVTGTPVPPFTFARVRDSQPRVHFIKDQWKNSNCPSFKPECQEKAYLIPGDIVVTNPLDREDAKRGMIYVSYYGAKHSFDGYLPAAALEPTQVVAKPNDFIGAWKAFDNHSIKISGSDGGLTIDALSFNHPLPGGTPDENDVSGSLIMQGGQAYYINDSANIGDDGCKIIMARIGGFLIARNNHKCWGGAAAPDFSGDYVPGDLGD